MPLDAQTPARHFLLRHRRTVIAVAALLALGLAPGVLRLSTDNSPEVFFVRNSEALARYERLRATFGSDEVVRLVAFGEALWSEAGLAWLGELEETAAALPGVVSVIGLYGRHSLMGWPPYDLEGFRQSLSVSHFDRSLGLVDREGQTSTVLAVLAPAPAEVTRELLEKLRSLLAQAPAGVETRLVGMPVLDLALDDSSREIGQRYFPLLAVVAIVILIAVFRDLGGVVLPLLFVGLCELGLLGIMGYAGAELNMILAILPPLLFVVALATALHLLLHDRALRAAGCSPWEAVTQTYREKGWAVLWTGVSTQVGFLSLAASPVGAVRVLGLWAGLGFGLMTFLAFTVYPVLILTSHARGLPPRLGAFECRGRELGRRWARWAGERRKRVVLVAALVTGAGLAGLPRLQVESNALTYLDPEHPVRIDVEALEARGIGFAAAEMMLTLSVEGASFAGAEEIGRLRELGEQLESEPLVVGAVSLGGLVDDEIRRLPLLPTRDPEVLRPLAIQNLEIYPEGRQVLGALVSDDRRTARLTLFLRTSGYEQTGLLLERARAAAEQSFAGARVEITGQYPLLLETQKYLITTLAVSLGLTFLTIAIIFRLILPGTRLAVLAILPNVWPIAVILGLMGWLEVPLDVATVMVASIVLGLAVDDTIHTLGHFRQLAPRHGSYEAIVHTLEQTAPAYLLTGLVLSAGFGVCALSAFAPTARFGALSALAIVLAVMGDLFLLPALLSFTPHRSVRRMGETGDQSSVREINASASGGSRPP